MINNIVLDSNAFFKSNRLIQLVKQSTPYTTPQVMEELKDQKTKEILQSFPFKIEVRQPSKQAIRFIKNFSILTGDNASLSDTDIGVIALSYDLIEKIGMKDKLNRQPKPFELPKTNPQDQQNNFSDDQNQKQSLQTSEQLKKQQKQNSEEQDKQPEQQSKVETTIQKQQQKVEIKKEIVQSKQKEIDIPKTQQQSNDDGWIQVKPKKKKIVKTKQSGLNDWITPQNYGEKKAKGLLNIQQKQISSIPQSDIPIWLITGDFAMQNVSMQIGIPTKASDGHQIFSLKRYIQMCYACGKTMKQNIDKILTCPKCGYNTLSKVAYTIDQRGNMILHKKKNWVPNKQVFDWKQKKIEEQAKHSRNQRKKKVKNMFD